MTRIMNVNGKFTDIFSYVKNILFLMALMTFGATNALAQTDLSGVYYIASGGLGENNGKKTTYNYNSSDPTNNFYLCPTEGWCYFDSTESSENDFSGTDTGKPFLTTYKCRDGVYDAINKAVWVIEKAPNSNYYYIKQWNTNNYLVANGIIRTTSGGWDRMRIHLEEVTNPSDKGNNILFNIYDYTKDNKTYKVIQPIGIDEPAKGFHDKHNTHKWLTVSTGNYNNLVGNSDKTNGPTGYVNTAGIVGIYTEDDANAPFYLEEARVARPTFSMNAAGDVTITVPDGTTVHYTLDGTEPTTNSTEYTAVITAASIPAGQTVKAIAVPNATDRLPSVVATLPLITYRIVNLSNGIAVSSSAIRQLAGTPLRNGNTDANDDGITDGYNDIPEELRSPYISNETITFYTMEGDFDASKLDNEHKITATPDKSANIYVTYTTDKLDEKFLHLQMARPMNLRFENPSSTWKYLWDNNLP